VGEEVICSPTTEVGRVRNSGKCGTIHQEIKVLLPQREHDAICLSREEEDRVVWRAVGVLGAQREDQKNRRASRRGVGPGRHLE